MKHTSQPFNVTSALVVSLLTSCAAVHSPIASTTRLHFDRFLTQAESLALVHRVWEPQAGLYPLAGLDFNLEDSHAQGGMFAKYMFSRQPCLSPKQLEAAAEGLGYIKDPKGEPIDGDPREHDLFLLRGDRRGRALNADYWPETDYQCLRALFVDYPRKMRPNNSSKPTPLRGAA